MRLPEPPRPARPRTSEGCWRGRRAIPVGQGLLTPRPHAVPPPRSRSPLGLGQRCPGRIGLHGSGRETRAGDRGRNDRQVLDAARTGQHGSSSGSRELPVLLSTRLGEGRHGHPSRAARGRVDHPRDGDTGPLHGRAVTSSLRGVLEADQSVQWLDPAGFVAWDSSYRRTASKVNPFFLVAALADLTAVVAHGFLGQRIIMLDGGAPG